MRFYQLELDNAVSSTPPAAPDSTGPAAGVA